MENSYREALDFLFNQLPMFSRTGAPAYKPGLETSIELSKYFGDPHINFKSIHIGGTNGKGSTSHMLASILQEQGYKVGLYTSPHLVDFRERMRINGKMIPEEMVVGFVNNWKKSGYEGRPSFFELTMIMAFDWFAKEKVDYAVIEVGMGGRLDSTNIITPILSVITNISHDHNQFLGETLEKIAAEKAGIIKYNIPVVIGETQDETETIFLDKANANRSEIIFADQSSTKVGINHSDNGWYCHYKELRFNLPLGGDYQKKNLLTVLTAIDKLKSIGINITDEAIKKGLEKVCSNTGLAGRWMIISDNPLTIADTGHNIAGIGYNVNQLKHLISKRQDAILRFVIGFVADKAIDKIMAVLPKDAVYYITNAQIPRALSSDKLLEKMKDAGFIGLSYSNVTEAYQAAKTESSSEDIIFIGGSTFIVADFLENLNLLRS